MRFKVHNKLMISMIVMKMMSEILEILCSRLGQMVEEAVEDFTVIVY
jgi:hypothetical protein